MERKMVRRVATRAWTRRRRNRRSTASSPSEAQCETEDPALTFDRSIEPLFTSDEVDWLLDVMSANET